MLWRQRQLTRVILLVGEGLDSENFIIAEDDVAQRAVKKLPSQESGPCQPFGLRRSAEQLSHLNLARTHPQIARDQLSRSFWVILCSLAIICID